MSDESTVPGEGTAPQAEPAKPPNVVPIPAESAPVSAAPVDSGYTAGGVPTFESVREKIETRFGTALGAAELAAETGRSIEEQYDARQRAAAERLAQIRESMQSGGQPSPGGQEGS